MTRGEVEAMALSLPATTKVVQWGESDVFKVGGKVFAMAGPDDDPGYVLKTSEISFEVLTQSGLASRAPYLPRGGWLRLEGADVLPDEELKAYLAQSHQMVAQGLSKVERRRLGLIA